MKNKILIGLCMAVMTILLVGCGTTEVTYKTEFPKQNSPALADFVRYYMMNDTGNFLYQDGDKQVYAATNEHGDESVDYFYVEGEGIEKSIEALLGEDDPAETFRNLTVHEDTVESLMQPIDHTDTYDLPEITLKNNNQLQVKTTEDNKTFDLTDILQDYHVEAEDSLIINVTAVSDDAFAIDIRNKDKEDQDEFIRVYIKKDFSDMAFTSTYVDAFNKHAANGDLNEFTELIAAADTDDRYVPLTDGYGILDTEKGEVIPIDDQDEASRDDHDVYLDGNKKRLSDGVQYIQSAEDYAAGTDQNVAEFDIRFEKIAEELGLETSGTSIADVIYFDQDYIALALNYKGKVVGDAGFTNVLIDLQDKEEPVAYVVDLGRH